MSSKNSEDYDEGLTTDARPSAPRENKENAEENNEENEEEEEKYPEYSRQTSSENMKKRPQMPNNAYASVINISNSNGIHIGSNYTVIMNSPNKNATKINKTIIETAKVINLKQKTKPVTTRDISFISMHMNQEWRDTARVLGYSDGQISHFYEDYVKVGLKEVIYKFLLDWIQNEADDATVGKLATAMWNTNQRDAVLRWSEICT